MAETKDRRHAATGAGARREAPDLEGARATAEDVGALPVPLGVRQQKGQRVEPDEGAPVDVERGLLPGARRPHPPARRAEAAPVPAGLTISRDEEAQLRRTVARASRTPEELGAALSRIGSSRDPQAGREAGPPLPNERSYEGKD